MVSGRNSLLAILRVVFFLVGLLFAVVSCGGQTTTTTMAATTTASVAVQTTTAPASATTNSTMTTESTSTTGTPSTTATTVAEVLLPGMVKVANAKGLADAEITASLDSALSATKAIKPTLDEVDTGANVSSVPEIKSIIAKVRKSAKPTMSYINQADPVATIRAVEAAWIDGGIGRPTIKERWPNYKTSRGFGPAGLLARDGTGLGTQYPGSLDFGAYSIQAKPLLMVKSGQEIALVVGCENRNGAAYTMALRLPRGMVSFATYITSDHWLAPTTYDRVEGNDLFNKYSQCIVEEQTIDIFLPFTADGLAKIREIQTDTRETAYFDDPINLKSAETASYFTYALAMSRETSSLPLPFFVNPEPDTFSESTIARLPIAGPVSAPYQKNAVK